LARLLEHPFRSQIAGTFIVKLIITKPFIMKFLMLTLFFLSTLAFATAGLLTWGAQEQHELIEEDNDVTTTNRVLKGGGATVSDPKARPTGRSLSKLSIDWWKWYLCGGDGNVGELDFPSDSPNAQNRLVFLKAGRSLHTARQENRQLNAAVP